MIVRRICPPCLRVAIGEPAFAKASAGCDVPVEAVGRRRVANRAARCSLLPLDYSLLATRYSLLAILSSLLASLMPLRVFDRFDEGGLPLHHFVAETLDG